MNGIFSPQRMLPVTLVLFVLLWTIVPALLHTALPLDVVESGSWGRELVLLSYKHPNLPGLLIEAAYRVTGQYGWPQYLVSALAGALTIWLVARLGTALFGAAAGSAGALLLLGCYYFTWPIPEFNHNIAQLPVWAAIALLLWSAVRDDRAWQWLLLGLVAGVGLYAKLSTLSLILAGGIWILADARARSRLSNPAAWAGFAVFAAIGGFFAWQVLQGGGGVVTFVSASGARGGGPVSFVGAQVLDLVPMLVVLVVALAWPGRRSESLADTGDLGRARLFLMIMFAVPLLTAIGTSAVTGAQAMWGTPMLNLVGLVAVAALPERFDASAMRRTSIAALVLVALSPGLFALRHAITQETAASPLRAQWPQAEIAGRLADIWAQETDAPLTIVGGNDWVSGLIALEMRPRASVYYRLDSRLSPWVSPERVAAEGMLVVWQGREPPDYAQPYLKGHVTGVETFTWSGSAAARPIEIGYAVVPPPAVR